jgi:hypothetical protein
MGAVEHAMAFIASMILVADGEVPQRLEGDINPKH